MIQKTLTPALALIFIVLLSCSTASKKNASTQTATGDNSQVSLDWPGVYQGVLPCADCEGIKTQLVLNEDLSYILQTQYMGEYDSIFTVNGSFEWNDSGSKISLKNQDNHQYLVGENQLFRLDREGNRITGSLENHYILKKEQPEITNKYWKLITLNGKQVKTGMNEAFITLHTEENRVHGNAGCNSFFGQYSLSGNSEIKFEQMGMTRMACQDMGTEDEFMQALDQAAFYALTENEMALLDSAQQNLASFKSVYLY